MISAPELAQQLITAFDAKDLPGALAFFADDAVVIDPNYPVAEMRGKEAIRQGFEWAFANIEKMGFTIRHQWEGNGNGAIEVDTHHILKGGMHLKFPQVFVIEIRDGKITRLQSFLPHGPGGIGGLLTRLVRFTWRLQGKIH